MLNSVKLFLKNNSSLNTVSFAITVNDDLHLLENFSRKKILDVCIPGLS